MKNFTFGVASTTFIASSAYYLGQINYQAIGLLAINNAIGVLYNLEAILLAV